MINDQNLLKHIVTGRQLCDLEILLAREFNSAIAFGVFKSSHKACIIVSGISFVLLFILILSRSFKIR